MKAIDDRAKAIEEMIASIVARAVKEYKDSDSFETNIVTTAISTYATRFDNCKKKVAEASQL